MLDVDETGNSAKMSYAFRPLTKNNYLSKRKDGSASILAKGRALFPEIKPLIAAGGASETKRVIEVSRMAALMEKNGGPLSEVYRVIGAMFYPLCLLAKHRLRDSVHHPLHWNAGSRRAPSGGL